MSASPSTGSSGIGPTEPAEDDSEGSDHPAALSWVEFKRYFPKTFFTSRGRQVLLIAIAFNILDVANAVRYGEFTPNPEFLLWDAALLTLLLNVALLFLIVPIVLMVMDLAEHEFDLEVDDA